MSELIVSQSTDFTGDPLLLGIEDILFVNSSGVAAAIFSFKQARYPTYLDTFLMVTGSDGDNQIVIDPGDQLESLFLIYWTFVNWSSADQIIINGSDSSDSVYGTKYADIIRGNDGNDWLESPKGADIISGGRGNDHFKYNGRNCKGSQIDGGPGFDSLEFRAAEGVDYSIDLTYQGDGNDIGDGTKFLSIETLAFYGLDGRDNVTGGRGGNLMNGGAGIDRLSGGDSGDLLYGNRDNDRISGGGGEDVLRGGLGNDLLLGGQGLDSLKGGMGNDAFRYESVASGGDSISDFSSVAPGNNDRFQLDAVAFGLTIGGLLATQFQSNDSAVAETADVRLLYELDTGLLRFDADGNGIGEAVVLATLQVGAAVTIDDFVIV